MADGEAPKIAETVEFKKPVVEWRGKLAKSVEIAAADSSSTEQIAAVKKEKVPKLSRPVNIPIPYSEPTWSGLCPDGSGYSLEILKSGVILDRVDLTKRPFFVFGRLSDAHIILTHPTSSRYHAVLQYKAEVDTGQRAPGWYLYDLNSTHGTFHNGIRLKQEYFSRVRVGHQIKFGTSSRSFILMGPDYDCEGESDLTVTEIREKAKQMKLEKERIVKEATEQKERERLEMEMKREEQGIDWGMGEDAEEETDLADNPYAVAANEELYLADPKKTLRGYFEREGLELSYDCEDRGVGQFICRVQLPMDDARGKPVVAEVVHRGKKKEAVVACALEACRVLDRAGLLRQAKQESRRRKRRDWGAEDYYDSDEDTFLDRTGAVESKRDSRMRRRGALPADQTPPMTHDQLLKEVAELESKISAEEKVLEQLRKTGKQAMEESGEDALDAYMSSLGRQTMGQKAEISNAKLNIQKLKVQLSKTRRLAELSRPADAPPLVKRDDRKLIKMSNSVVYGKRIKLKEDMDRKPKARKEVKTEEKEFVVELDSDEEESADNKKLKSESPERVTEKNDVDIQIVKKEVKEDSEPIKIEDEKSSGVSVIRKATKKDDNKSPSTEDNTEATKRVFGPMRPPDDYVIPENYFDQETDRDLPELEEKEMQLDNTVLDAD